MSNITSCDSGSFSTENTREDALKQQQEMLGQFHSPHSHTSTTTTNNSNGSNNNSQPPAPVKKKRSLPGNPDPSAEVIALSPNTLMATNRFICEICNKGFQRDQNLQLHRRGHNLPWKLKQRTSTEIRKRVYVCPEPSCVHHNPARALGDLTGIKKHFCRKHGEKKWKCDKCSKKYAVQSDWKAHSKICGTREYKCDCGTIFSRRDSFISHRAFCDALAEENNKANEGQLSKIGSNMQCQPIPNLVSSLPLNTNIPNPQIGGASKFNHSDHKHPLSLPQELMPMPSAKPFNSNMPGNLFTRSLSSTSSPSLQLSSNMFEENGLHLAAGSPHMSATALLQKAAQMGATVTEKTFATNMAPPSFGVVQQQQQPNGQSFMNQYMHNGQHDINISAQYTNFGANGMGGGGVGMNGVDMFNAILDQSKALSKIIEQNSRSNSGGPTNGGSSSAINIGGTKGSGDVTTLDLLGIGGGGGGGAAAAHGNFYGGTQQAESGAADEVWRNWSSKNAGFESFSATSSI
ncbi:zinc finger protein GAI-ASSOCIATED FACTOR 1-like isoform X1 [Abrus precatorius]|uniref:Zinc finger protein GAI-ASSOCIATED FACTOR 1-like isoform X1 n=1 Tax=Abrus precatorius TaxID=3816 RepID=A0A8B8MAP3_ABRPR|nr:zinc finger protein GAI-ASSOCIATED FACTOR 1-like isoform X1 [Abrus precatorius]